MLNLEVNDSNKRSSATYEGPIGEGWGTLDAFLSVLMPQKVDAPVTGDWRIRKLKEFIDTHPQEARRSLDDVCKLLDLPMSGRQARRLFKLWTGVGVRVYARNNRLTIAIKQLQRASTPIKAVAADLGFQNSRQFSRTFKEVLGLSPQEFRKAWSTKALDAGLERSA